MANVAFLLGDQAQISVIKSEREKNAYNGRKEPFLLLQLLANNNPENTYYVTKFMSKGRFETYTEEDMNNDFPNKNVRFVVNEFFDDLKKIKGGTPVRGGDSLHPLFKERLEKFVDYLVNEVKIEYGICFCTFNGQGIPGVTRNIRPPYNFSKLLSNHCACVYGIHFLNVSKIPYITYSVDMRYLNEKQGAVTHPMSALVCFKDGEKTFRYLKDLSFETQINRDCNVVSVPTYYLSTDTLMMTGEEASRFDINKKNDSTLKIYFNQLKGCKFDRLKYITNFGLFDSFNEKELQVFSNLDSSHECYKEGYMNPSLKHEDYFNSMENQKYTLLFPSSEETFTSAKPWESIHMGVVPFMTSDFGSEEWRKFHDMPDFLFVNDAAELKMKIDELESSIEKYKEVIQPLVSKMESGIYDGTLLNDNLNGLIKKILKK